jgi:hypothetical protein
MEGVWIVAGGLLCVGIFLTLIVVLTVVTRRRERERQEALYQWATQHEWQMTRRPPATWARRMPGGRGGVVSLALNGTLAGRPVAIGEYSYTTTTSSGSDGATSTETHHYVLTVVWLRQPAPTMSVSRRGSMSKLGRTLFGDRATAVGHEAFDRAYRVSANDPRLIPAVLRPPLVVEQLTGRLPDWSVEGHEVLTYRSGRIGDPASIPAQFAGSLRIADLIDPR